MEEIKSNSEIRSEASAWVAKAAIVIKTDESLKSVVLSPFLAPWQLAVTIGEAISSGLRWRTIAPNPSPRMQCLQVTDFHNLLEWPLTVMPMLLVKPDNVFDAPSRSDMVEHLESVLGGGISIGDIIKAENGWAVATSGYSEIPDKIRGFSIRVMSDNEINALNAVTSSGPRTLSVSSARIDAVSAKAFKPSREQVKKHLESGGVLLNYKPARKAGHELAPGDVVAVRGWGRYVYDGIDSATKKGRLMVNVTILNGS